MASGWRSAPQTTPTDDVERASLPGAAVRTGLRVRLCGGAGAAATLGRRARSAGRQRGCGPRAQPCAHRVAGEEHASPDGPVRPGHAGACGDRGGCDVHPRAGAGQKAREGRRQGVRGAEAGAGGVQQGHGGGRARCGEEEDGVRWRGGEAQHRQLREGVSDG
eukprot:2039228-Prymnesium_polylepis.1